MRRAATRLQEQWHHVAGRPVRSIVAGAPQAGVPELVVVPGLGATGYLLPTVRSCAQWTRVHLLDLPGFGHRATARMPSDLASTARTLAAWLAQAAPPGALLLGHSTGAQIALRGAIAAPARVHVLVMAGATFPPQARRLVPLAGRALATAVHEDVGEVPAVLPCYLRGAPRVPTLLRTTMDDRPEDLVPDLVPPLLVLRGEQDRICPQDWAERLAGLAGSGDVRVLPGAHNFVYTHPKAASDVLLQAAAG